MSDDTVTGILILGIIAAVAVLCFVWFMIGRDSERCRQARKDIADAKRMRATIRDYDDRIDQFVSQNKQSSESITRHPWRGPERCLCEDCTRNGVPPSP